METVNTNLSALLLQLNQNITMDNFNQNSGVTRFNNFVNNDTAFSFFPETGNVSGFEALDAFAAFKDIVYAAREGIFQMQNHGESIRDLITKAKEGDLSEETLKAIQDEVDSRIKAINDIKNGADFNGVNPFNTAISLQIPNWQNMFGIGEENETAEGEITNTLAEIQFDMTIDGNMQNSAFNIGASATIKIGYTDEGALQIEVDASMDFDLSGLENGGFFSDDAMDIINNFIAMLTGKEQDLGTADNILNGLYASASASIMGDGFAIDATNDINISNESSKSIQGQIVQHAKITLDSTANQIPSIAINLL